MSLHAVLSLTSSFCTHLLRDASQAGEDAGWGAEENPEEVKRKIKLRREAIAEMTRDQFASVGYEVLDVSSVAVAGQTTHNSISELFLACTCSTMRVELSVILNHA